MAAQEALTTPGPAARQLAVIGGLAALELALARCSGGPQAGLDVAIGLAGWALIAAVTLRLARIERPTAHLAALALPAAWLAVGVGLPPFLGHGRWLPVLVLAGSALAVSAAAWGADRLRAPEAMLVPTALAAGVAWTYDGAAPALLAMLLPLALGALASAVARIHVALVGVAVLATAALALVPGAAPTPRSRPSGPPSPGPEVVLVVVDTLRYDLGAVMASTARVADAGARFTDATAASPWTLPSMATVMTGHAAAVHGAHRPPTGAFQGIADSVPTLAELLGGAGYETAAVVAMNGFVGPRFGFDRGFQTFDHGMALQRHALPRAFAHSVARPVLCNLLLRLGLLGRVPHYDADAIVDRGLAVLARPRDRPLFLWLHLLDPHLPYRHAGATLGSANRATIVGDPWWTSTDGLATLRAGYTQEVAVVDAALNRLLDGLGPPPERGRILILTSDHGEELGEHGGLEHGHALWQEVVAVPLAISGLSVRGPVDTPVGHLDLAPTILAAAGLPTAGLPGRELGRRLPPTALTVENLLHGPPDAWAVRAGSYKLVHHDTTRLHDLALDPGETTDEALARPDLVQALSRLAPAPPGQGREPDPDAIEDALLRVLGYRVPE